MKKKSENKSGHSHLAVAEESESEPTPEMRAPSRVVSERWDPFAHATRSEDDAHENAPDPAHTADATHDDNGANDDSSSEDNDSNAPWLQLDMVAALESILFASGQPLGYSELKKIFARYFGEENLEDRKRLSIALKAALTALQEKWQSDELQHGGFQLMDVAEGYTFRSNATYASVLQAMREDKPVRLTRPAMETLAIVAYRQPVTKPEADYIRGVDCGGTLKVLLDRDLVRIVGKKEEPGRPLLYGTTREFLSFFNLTDLTQLPSLRQFHELNEDTQEELRTAAGGLNLQELSDTAAALRFSEEPAVQDLDEAVAALANTEDKARMAFAGAGIQLTEVREESPVSVSSPLQATVESDR